MVLLVREMDGEQLFVQKTLQGRHEIYETLQNNPHPYLPKIHEITIADNSTVVLEEYIDGHTLDSAALTEKQICAAIKELCVVLGFLHEKGIIHRDVKPSNIMMASDGHVCLIDFDTARRIKDNVEQDTKLLGTKGYAPPEQFGFSQTDARADIYSLGVTIEQLLGERAKKPKYKRIIRKCTDLNPDKRYQSVKGVKNAFSFHRRRLPYISAAMFVALLSWGVTLWLIPPAARQVMLPSSGRPAPYLTTIWEDAPKENWPAIILQPDGTCAFLANGGVGMAYFYGSYEETSEGITLHLTDVNEGDFDINLFYTPDSYPPFPTYVVDDSAPWFACPGQQFESSVDIPQSVEVMPPYFELPASFQN